MIEAYSLDKTDVIDFLKIVVGILSLFIIPLDVHSVVNKLSKTEYI